MELAEIEREAFALPDADRAKLAADLLGTLPPPSMEVSDAEADRRDDELESGAVKPITHEEFVRGVLENRGR